MNCCRCAWATPRSSPACFGKGLLGLSYQAARRQHVALPVGDAPSCVVGPLPDLGWRALQRAGCGRPVACFGQVAAHLPEAPHGRQQAHGAVRRRPARSRRRWRLAGCRARARRCRARRSARPPKTLAASSLRQANEVVDVSPARFRAWFELRQSLHGEGPDREQHAEARLIGFVHLLAKQALVEQRSHRIQGVGRRTGIGRPVGQRHALHSGRSAPPANTARRAKATRSPASSRSWLQSMAPRSVCWRAGRLLRAAGQQAELVSQAREDGLRGQQPDARRRQLDGQRQAIQPHADLGNGRGVRGIHREARAARPWRARRRGPPTRTARASSRSGRCCGSGSASGGTGYSCSP